MKKNIFLALFLLLSLNGFCQTEGLYFGVGGNLSTNTKDLEIGLGFQTGLTTIQKLNDQFFLNPTLQFSYLNNTIIKSKYFTTIFAVNYLIEENAYIGFGPYAALFHGAKADSYDLGAQHKSFDYGLSPAIGFFVSKKTSLELRYMHGITNIVRSLNDKNFSNRSIQLSLFFLIREKDDQN